MKIGLERRGMCWMITKNEMEVSVNGPPLCRDDGIIKAALNTYFEGGNLHFV
jgi:hypothetical protein